MSNVKEVNIAPTTEVATEIVSGVVSDTSVVPDPVAPDPVVPEDNMTARFAALSRKEKEVREAQEVAKSDAAKYQEYKDLEGLAKTDPMAILSKYGMSLDDLITHSLGADDTPATVEEQLIALREEIANEKKSVEDKAKASQDAEEKALQDSIDTAVLKHKGDIDTHLQENKDKYELINIHGGQGLVWEVTEQWFDANNGEILSPDVAASKVEAYYEEQVRKSMQLSRFKEAQGTNDPVSTQFETTTPKRDIQTLTSESSSPAGSKTVHLNDEESKRAAAALIQWT
tara:strand:- start:198 stop:1055 length:858 start_codon:yes stop_codon:yes gene_type:complete